MKLVVLYILFVPVVFLAFAGISAVSGFALNSLGNPGAHGLTEITLGDTATMVIGAKSLTGS
jgi:K+-transporting ATPase ATPase A chain